MGFEPTTHVVLLSFVFVIGPTERGVFTSYTMVVLARLHDQCIGANRQSELVIPNWFYNWFSLHNIRSLMHIPRVNISLPQAKGTYTVSLNKRPNQNLIFTNYCTSFLRINHGNVILNSVQTLLYEVRLVK